MKLIQGNCTDVLRTLSDQSIHCCITSPPYFRLRDYGVDGQLGQEASPEEFINALVSVFREVRRVLRDDGTLWLNLGDSYASNEKYRVRDTECAGDPEPRYAIGEARYRLNPKNLMGIPWRVALALQADGWYLRQDIIWHKPNALPENVTDRCTKAHEYIFLLSKRRSYYFDHAAIKEPALGGEKRQGGLARDRLFDYNSKQRLLRPSRQRGKFANRRGELRQRKDFRQVQTTRNRRSVWAINTRPYQGAHMAPFPPELVEPCLLAGAPVGGVVLDPFMGSGTTGAMAQRHGRDFVGIDLNPEFVELARGRIAAEQPSGEVAA